MTWGVPSYEQYPQYSRWPIDIEIDPPYSRKPPPFHVDWNLYEDENTMKVRVNLEKVIKETIAAIMQMEEETREKVLIEYLRAKGHYIVENAGIPPKYDN